MKPKGKARSEGLEILANANLKLKAGVHYALIGRNGTGKSSELIHAAQEVEVVDGDASYFESRSGEAYSRNSYPD